MEQSPSQKAVTEIAALLRARNILIWVVSREEARVERHLIEAAKAAGFYPRSWDVAQGISDTTSGKQLPEINGPDPGDALNTIRQRATANIPADQMQRDLWIMRDLPPWFQGPAGAPIIRAVRNLARLLPGIQPNTAQAIIIISPSGEVPPELGAHVTLLEWPLPARDEIGRVVDGISKQYEDKIEPLNGQREAVIDAVIGLTDEEAKSCFSKSIVQFKKLDPIKIGAEKKRIITREKVLEWHDPLPGGLTAVGGLENMKKWLLVRSQAYSPEARAYGLPLPRGVFAAGVSGCGKSMMAKAIATAWGVPLLRYDPNALKSKFVGETEQQTRKAQKVIAAIGRCVVWVDEIEKAMQGATSGSADGGVSADILGSFLTWMQEKTDPSFIFVTANDIDVLPPELLRKGRFDELFFVDLPTATERAAILEATLRQFKRDPKTVNVSAIAGKPTENFTGSEIASIVSEALFAAFADGKRELNTEDLLTAAKAVVKLADTAKEKIERIRKWGRERARPASVATVEEAASMNETRVLDII